MKKKRKLSLKKIMIAKIDHPNDIIGKGDTRTGPSAPGVNCRTPSDTSPGRTEGASECPCIHEGTGIVCA